MKAKSRLRVAEKAILELSDAKDYLAFSDTWYTFLVAAKNVYTVLEQGSKPSPQSRQWFGGVKQTRKDDELLQYLFEARNDDEHGLESSTEEVPGSLSIGVNKPGHSQMIRLDGQIGFGGTLKVTSLDNKPVHIEVSPPSAKLVSISARGNRVLPPPQVHRGVAIEDNSPAYVANLALLYLTELVAEAEKLG